MLKTIQLTLLLSFAIISFAQESQIDEGIKLHDAGKYDEAIKKYNEALKIDNENLLAMAEKAYSQLLNKDYTGTIKTCKQAIKLGKKQDKLKFIYTTYGSALDFSGKPVEALKTYSKGIKEFPDYYLLHYNKGITHTGLNEYEDAIKSFQSAVEGNPNHSSSHNAMARISLVQEKKIPSLLAYLRFFVLEPQSARANVNLGSVKDLVNGNVEKTGENEITINIPSTSLDKKGKKDDFRSIEMILSMVSALDHDDKNKDKTEIERFTEKLETTFATMGESKKGNKGFFWNYYAPYFIDLNENELEKTLAHLVYATAQDEKIDKWLQEHEKEIKEFYEWSNNYKW